ncbi:MAG: putative PEP-binding protein [Pseudomonadota bacterium]
MLHDGTVKRDTETLGWIGLPGPDGAPAALPDAARFGEKTALLARAAALGAPVPPGFALTPAAAADPQTAVRAFEEGLARLEAATGARLGDPAAPLLLALRPAALPGGLGDGAGSGGAIAPSILNLGVTPAGLPALAARFCPRTAQDLDRRFVQSFGVGALGIDADAFDYALDDALRAAGSASEAELDAAALARLAADCRAIAAEEGAPVPDDPRAQLEAARAGLVAAWQSPRAALRREARGGRAEAPLALIVQVMAIGLGPEAGPEAGPGAGPETSREGAAALSGAGLATPRCEETGAPRLAGRFLPAAQGEEALMGLRTPMLLTAEERAGHGLAEPALEEAAPAAFATLRDEARRIEEGLGDAYGIDFTLEAGRLWITELRRARRSARAAVRIAVDLADAGAIGRDDALLRIDPAALEAHLHPSIDAEAVRDIIGRGLPASPGAASGALVFTPDAAEQAAAAGRAAILALTETSPEDIRGMHAASAVLTVRGGMTSHAAVVARGLGTPCVVGAKTLRLGRHTPQLIAADGRVFNEGDIVTVDGGSGQVIAGAVPTRPPEITGAFARLMGWADETRRLAVRANADTGADARVARDFAAGGIGLCRTEHMFFQGGRIGAMRRMILAGNAEDRRAALAELQPMQQADFTDLFTEMAGLPVVIRLLDPPLHEFLPHAASEIAELGRTLGLDADEVQARARELAEFNPMLGKRGCRLGIAYPEIYEMQVRAILEAAIEAAAATGKPVVPEIMIPLVSAVRELELLRERIDAVAEALRSERAAMVDYRVGVMLETPRACLRAGDIAALSDFISYGTNDLTQMIYGLSRDDAGRFIPDYVAMAMISPTPSASRLWKGSRSKMPWAT